MFGVLSRWFSTNWAQPLTAGWRDEGPCANGCVCPYFVPEDDPFLCDYCPCSYEAHSERARAETLPRLPPAGVPRRNRG